MRAFNAITAGAALGDHVIDALGLAAQPVAGGQRMSRGTRTPAIVLGGTGYVAGELLRLLAAHPDLDLAAVASDSQPGEPVAQFFRHLRRRCRTCGSPAMTRCSST